MWFVGLVYAGSSADVAVGRRFFQHEWTAEEGLGPVYNDVSDVPLSVAVDSLRALGEARDAAAFTGLAREVLDAANVLDEALSVWATQGVQPLEPVSIEVLVHPVEEQRPWASALD